MTTIQDRIRHYLGKGPSHDVTRTAKVISLLNEMNETERYETVAAMRGFFCTSCGSDDPSCQCWNDE